MKNFLKITTFIIASCCSTQMQAQIGQVNISDCFIRYTYDAAGNRIKREFVCESSGQSLKSVPIAQQITDENILVYPNPTYDYVMIDLPVETNNGKVLLNDINGKTISEFTIVRNLQIPTSHLVAGTYMIIITDNKNKYVRKITKM